MSERDKFLTEAMGECWHNTGQRERGTFYYLCSKCRVTFLIPGGLKRDFSTWEGFGKLLAYVDGEMSDKEIAVLLYRLAIDGCVQNIHNRFATAVYEYLKDRR